MCVFASFIVCRDERVFYLPGVDSHTRLHDYFKGDIPPSCSYGEDPFTPIEITPTDPHLYLEYNHLVKAPPEDLSEWKLRFDIGEPEWWTASHERAARSALSRLIQEEDRGYETVFPDGSWYKGRRHYGVPTADPESIDSNGIYTRRSFSPHPSKPRTYLGELLMIFQGGPWLFSTSYIEAKYGPDSEWCEHLTVRQDSSWVFLSDRPGSPPTLKEVASDGSWKLWELPRLHSYADRASYKWAPLRYSLDGTPKEWKLLEEVK